MPTVIKSARRELAAENLKWPSALREIPPHQWPGHLPFLSRHPVRVLRSREFLAQVYQGDEDHLRLTIHRTAIDDIGEYRGGITWDQLQRLKREAGYGHWWAVEVYPADAHVMRAANQRHLWLSREAFPFAWTVNE